MPISEIRCYHNGCPKRKFFNSLPIDHIFIYATLGPTNRMYDATAYCIFEENYRVTAVPDVEKKFIKIAGKVSPIDIFLEGEEKPQYYQSLNALAFKYEIKFKYKTEMQSGEKEVLSSFYLALRKKCLFKHENIAEIKVLKKDRKRTEEAAFLKSLDVEVLKEGIEQLRSIGVYEKIHSRDITEEYEEEKTPINKFNRMSDSGFLTFSQHEQTQDLLNFFAVFLPPTYSTGPLKKQIERINSKDPKELLEEKYGRIQRERRSIGTTINEEDRGDYLDIFSNVEATHRIYQIWVKKFHRAPGVAYTQSELMAAQQNFERGLLEAEDFIKKRKI